MIGSALTCLLLLRSSKSVAEKNGRVQAVYCLRDGDVVFCVGERKVESGSSSGMDTEELKTKDLRATKGKTGKCW